MASIYVLKDPITNEVRYVGKTIRSLDVRLKYHIQDAKYNKSISKKNSWVKSLLNKGLVPKIELLEQVDESNIDLVEMKWIKHFRGERLTNMTDGGDGISNPSKEIRDKIRQSLKQTRGENYIPWNKGKKTSDDVKAKQSAAKDYKKKVLLQLDVQGNLVKEWSSLTSASKELGYNRSTLSKAALGQIKVSYGYVWKYKSGARCL